MAFRLFNITEFVEKKMIPDLRDGVSIHILLID